MKTKRIQVLNQTAARLWELLAAGNSRAEMQDRIQEEFSVDSNKLSSDIDHLLVLLEEEGLIQRHE